MMKTVIKIVGILGIAGILTGCGSTTTVTQTEFEMPNISNPAPPPQLQLREVEWRVLNKEKLEEIIAEAEKQNKNIALFALTADEYEDLSTNMQEIKGYISKQKEIIIFYRTTLKDIEQSVKESSKDEEKEDSDSGSGFLGIF